MIATGVYQTVSNHSALVFKVEEHAVYFIANMEITDGAVDTSNQFDAHVLTPDRFAHYYTRHLPGYPVRRCARVYVDSYFPKSHNAQRLLAHLLRV
jgi:hypothetical protein